MASVSSVFSLTSFPRICKEKKNLKGMGTRHIDYPVISGESQKQLEEAVAAAAKGYCRRQRRREILLETTTSALSLSACFQALISVPDDNYAMAAENNEVGDKEFRTYTDEANKFKLVIPQDWQVGSGEPNGFKSVTAFYPEEEEAASTSNVSVVITGLGPDFTRMESFGKVDAFADTLVSGLDRSWQRPPGVTAKLIDCNASNGIYYIEYTLKNPGESRKHLYSAIGMASTGWYNRLYTVTGQFVDENSEKYSSKIVKAIRSFQFIR